jgi:hypothetical protein
MENDTLYKLVYDDGVYVGQCTVEPGELPVKEGFGVFEYKDGNRYEGHYSEDDANGHGKLTWSDGTVYEGHFKDGFRDGLGKQIWSDGTVYEGEFSKGKQWGKGKLVWPSGESYIGWFANNRMEGHGIHYAADGTVIYDGEWIESCPVNKTS